MPEIWCLENPRKCQRSDCLSTFEAQSGQLKEGNHESIVISTALDISSWHSERRLHTKCCCTKTLPFWALYNKGREMTSALLLTSRSYMSAVSMQPQIYIQLQRRLAEVIPYSPSGRRREWRSGESVCNVPHWKYGGAQAQKCITSK